MRSRRCVAFLAILSTTACGGRTGGDQIADAGDAATPQGDSEVSDSGAVDAGSDVDPWSPDATGPWSPVCPTLPPTVGTACSATDRTQCEYGDAWWNASCNPIFWCQGGSWQVFSPGNTNCMPEPGPNPGGCPADQGAIGDTPCSQQGLQCYYGKGANCTCVPFGGDGGPLRWGCLPGAGCPTTRPRLGQSCSGDIICPYEACALTEACVGDLWQAINGGC
jgi:hypothetical protein